MITELTEDPKTALKQVQAAVVVFYAPWCSDCKLSEECEEKIAEEFKENIQFFRFDALEMEDTVERYRIDKYPTYMFFVKGKPQRGVLIEPFAEGEVRNWIEMKLERMR